MPDELPPCRVASWAEVDRWADAVAEKVVAEGRTPQTIVGLTRGGWVPARLLSDRLGVRRVVSLRAQHWGVTATPDGKAQLTEGLSGPVEGQSVLLADDITDTGESLALATDHVRSAGASRVESAAFLHIAHSRFLPTYYAEEIPRDAWVWVVFPWNYYEDVRTLVRRAARAGGGPREIRERLRERSRLDLSLPDIERAMGGPSE